MVSHDSAPSQISDRNSVRNSASDTWSVITGSNTGPGYLHESMQGYRSRRRRPFEPHEREEVAAVRRVGACASCHKRKIKCPHALSNQSALSLQALRSGRESEHTENSKIPSLSNSMPSATSSGGRTQSRRPSGDGKILDDSVMLERFLGSEGSVRWLDGMEAKTGYDYTDDKRDPKSIFTAKVSGLDHLSDLPYPTTIDFNFNEDIVVFPARQPVEGEGMPWDFHTGREATQPLRPQCRGVHKRKRSSTGNRRSGTAHFRLSSDPRLLDAVEETHQQVDTVGETARGFSQLNLAPTPRSMSHPQTSDSYNDTWGQSSQYTILPSGSNETNQYIEPSTAAMITSNLQDHIPATTASFPSLQSPWQPLRNTLHTAAADFPDIGLTETPNIDFQTHRHASYQGPMQATASDSFLSSLDSGHLTPMRYSQSFSYQRSTFLPQETLLLSPHTPLQDMSRQPSLGWESSSSRDGTLPLSPQLSRNYTRPSLDSFNQTAPSPLRQAHDQITQVLNVPPLAMAYPSDLIVEYSDGPPIKAPIDSYEFTSEEIDEQLRMWENRGE